MANEDVGSQSLEGPWSSHLYIGLSPANRKTVVDLCLKLKEKGVIYKLRETNYSIQESIRDGVTTSQKCLLFLTPDYVKDDWYKIETNAVIEKSKRFSRDVVIILKTQDLKAIPEGLQDFAQDLFLPETLNDEKFLAKISNTIFREPRVKLAVLPKQNFGYGAAYGYFYGFLRLVLPDFKKRLFEETLKSESDLVLKTIHKMLIIMPESCNCAPQLNSNAQIEFTGKYVVRVFHRAGNQNRDYKSSLFKLIDHEKQQDYYFVGELATPLLTMYETYCFGLSGMTKDQLYAERDVFYFTLKAILSHPDNAECNDQFKLLYWSDPEAEKPNKLDLYNFLLPVLRKEIILERENERNPSKMGTTTNVDSLPRQPPLLNTSISVPVDGSNPARIYDEIGRYPMDRRPRGLCLVVNIANFDEEHRHLRQRKGAERDEECLKKLFGDLHFTVQVHNDLNALDLESLFLATHKVNHTNYDAFVCCILTHGKLGVVYTSDGKPVKILSLVNFFTDKNCPSLKRKPKMFFIQACQRGDSAETCDAEGISSIQAGISNNVVTAVEQAMELEATSIPTIAVLDDSLPSTLRHKAVLVPGSPDFLMSYSTLPGSISYRNTQFGSHYIQALDKCLRKNMEIDRALKLVSSSVKNQLKNQDKEFQLPFHLTTGMDQFIYL